jgi:adenylate cyclase
MLAAGTGATSESDTFETGLGEVMATTFDHAALPQPHARDADSVRRQLSHVLSSGDFDASRRSREFLNFIVEETLAGRGEELSQPAIARQVFGRNDGFDALVDPIVRIQAGRLRRSLEKYYLLSGQRDPLRIELPKGGYVPLFRDEPAEPIGEHAAPAACAASDGWPFVAVIPFAASTPEALELAACLTDDLMLELGRCHAVRVTLQEQPARLEGARALAAKYALKGRVAAESDGWRIIARLVDSASDEQIWADEYRTSLRPGRGSVPLEDVARVVAARVGGEEGIVVQHLASERRRRPAAPTSYDAFLGAYEFFLFRDPSSLARTLQALRRIVEAEPECGLAWTRLAQLYIANHTYEVTRIPTPIDDAISHAQRGVLMDPGSRSARSVLATAFLVKGELAAARHELEEALRSCPGSLVHLEIIGYLLALAGEWDRGIAISTGARQRNPHCLPHGLFGIWADNVRRGAVEQAYQAALEYPDPKFFWRSVMRASCLGLLGRTAEARSEVTDLVARKPDFADRGRRLIGVGRIVDGLSKAGLKLA